MRAFIGLMLTVLLIGSSAPAENSPTGTSPFPEDYHSPAAPPPEDQPIRKYAVDEPGTGAENFGLAPVHDNPLFFTLRADRLEYRWFDSGEAFLWDAQAWIGRDYNKLYVESEGEWSENENKVESAKIELFYSRAVSSFWDLRVGGRFDPQPDPERGFAALGIMGLAPYRFEVDLNGYLSDEGDLSAILETEYHLMLTQRLVLQPRLETELAAQDVPEYGIGAGFTDIELGLRLRYEFTRKFAPYIGVSWESALGETANRIENNGGDPDRTAFVVGLHGWL